MGFRYGTSHGTSTENTCPHIFGPCFRVASTLPAYPKSPVLTYHQIPSRPPASCRSAFVIFLTGNDFGSGGRNAKHSYVAHSPCSCTAAANLNHPIEPKDVHPCPAPNIGIRLTLHNPSLNDTGFTNASRSDHDMFRESCRKFFEDEVKPFHGWCDVLCPLMRNASPFEFFPRVSL